VFRNLRDDAIKALVGVSVVPARISKLANVSSEVNPQMVLRNHVAAAVLVQREMPNAAIEQLLA
jgi:hypothetical protein